MIIGGTDDPLLHLGHARLTWEVARKMAVPEQEQLSGGSTFSKTLQLIAGLQPTGVSNAFDYCRLPAVWARLPTLTDSNTICAHADSRERGLSRNHVVTFGSGDDLGKLLTVAYANMV